jgi:hypothetical protein
MQHCWNWNLNVTCAFCSFLLILSFRTIYMWRNWAEVKEEPCRPCSFRWKVRLKSTVRWKATHDMGPVHFFLFGKHNYEHWNLIYYINSDCFGCLVLIYFDFLHFSVSKINMTNLITVKELIRIQTGTLLRSSCRIWSLFVWYVKFWKLNHFLL